MIAAGSAGEIGGLVLDATGVGAVIGIPVGAASAAAIVTGAVVAGHGVFVSANTIVNIYNQSTGNNNPYNGPVDRGVTVVDEQGNAMPVKHGEQIHSSPDGSFQQVKDRNGVPTGTRKDGGGHPKHNDPKARGPHGHQVDSNGNPITIKGNPHLPIK